MILEVKRKIIEEANELGSASPEDEVGEIADIRELIDLFCDIKRIGEEDLKSEQQKKVDKSGVFTSRVYIETAHIPEDSQWVEYFKSQPDKYPEIK